MGVDVAVGGATEHAFAEIATLFERWDRVFSRFRDDRFIGLLTGTFVVVHGGAYYRKRRSYHFWRRAHYVTSPSGCSRSCTA
jgi:hypothetical protein